MIALEEPSVDSMAPNPEAIKNGRGLVLKGKFLKFHISEDRTLLFGECQGSGKEPYFCSCDFLRPDSPTHRCSCPSRQFPCKHCLGLMYAYAMKKAFTTAAIPDDLQAKRDKVQARVEKKAVDVQKPKKVNKDALSKKIQIQLEGIEILERITNDLIRLGIGNMNAKIALEMESQARQLGNAYLPGAQNAVHAYTKLFLGDDGKYVDKTPVQREKIYGDALDQLSRLHSLVKQGRAYLKKRADDPDLKPETESPIAAWLGHAWQLAELKAAGLCENDVELVQLAFNTHDDRARQEFVDTGIWMNLNSGKILTTQTFRPYQAAKFIKSEDSVFQVAQIRDLMIYPGGVNPRTRWDSMTPRSLIHADIERIRGHAHANFATVIKDVKSQMKAPLADKQPVYAIRFQKLGRVGERFVAEDAHGERLELTDQGMNEEPPSCHLLGLLKKPDLSDNVLIARFHHDLDTRKLRIKPLSIVTRTEIRRLTL